MLHDIAILCKHCIKIHGFAKFTGTANRNFVEGLIQSRERPWLMYKNYYKTHLSDICAVLLQQIYIRTLNVQQHTENSPLKSNSWDWGIGVYHQSKMCQYLYL